MDTPSPAPVVPPSSVRPFPQVAQTATIGPRPKNKRTGRTQILTATPERIDQDTPVGAPAATVRKINHQVRRRLQQNPSADDAATIVNKAVAPKPPKRARRQFFQEEVPSDHEEPPISVPIPVRTRSGRAVKPKKRS